MQESPVVLVDAAGLALLRSREWRMFERITPSGRVYRYLVSGSRSLHRMLVQAPAGMVVDHINGNGLDNRLRNLRVCTHAENMRNRCMSRKNAAGFKGVWQRKSGGSFYAELTVDGVRHRKGGFKTAEEAAATWNEMAERLHGAFAKSDRRPQ
jgi:hypothetical protein